MHTSLSSGYHYPAVELMFTVPTRPASGRGHQTQPASSVQDESGQGWPCPDGDRYASRYRSSMRTQVHATRSAQGDSTWSRVLSVLSSILIGWCCLTHTQREVLHLPGARRLILALDEWGRVSSLLLRSACLLSRYSDGQTDLGPWSYRASIYLSPLHYTAAYRSWPCQA